MLPRRFIEVGWWRGPGTYTFATDYAGTHDETSVECGSGFGSVLVPAHGTATVEVDMPASLPPGDYDGAIQFTVDGEAVGVVATFASTVVEDRSPARGRLTRR